MGVRGGVREAADEAGGVPLWSPRGNGHSGAPPSLSGSGIVDHKHLVEVEMRGERGGEGGPIG